jgi:hypothetical protein
MATITGKTGGRGSGAVATRDPPITGLTAGTTRQKGRKPHLHPQKGTFVPQRLRKGL